jgi:hypothetical protein
MDWASQVRDEGPGNVTVPPALPSVSSHFPTHSVGFCELIDGGVVAGPEERPNRDGRVEIVENL